MAILTRAGRAAIAKAIKNMPVHVAIGRGDGAWTTSPPPENANAVALMDEIARRTATSVDFLVPDVGGDIEIVGAGTFSVSDDPTNNLLITCRFDFEDAVDEEVREVAVFVESVMVGGLPPGQVYFEPADIASPGMLLQLENREPVYRTSATRETFEILIVF